MIKRTRSQRIAEQKQEAIRFNGIASKDMALKIFEDRLIAMPERKLTYQSRNQSLVNKRYDMFSNS